MKEVRAHTASVRDRALIPQGIDLRAAGAAAPQAPPATAGFLAPARRRDAAFADRLMLFSLFCDLAVVTYALLAAFWLRFEWGVNTFHTPAPIELADYLPYIVSGIASLIFTLSSFHLYEKQSLLRYRYVGMQVVKACAVWFSIFLAITLIFHFRPFISRLFVTMAGINVTVGLLVWRAIFHRVLRRSEAATHVRQRILFIGWNEDAGRLATASEEEEHPVYEIVGCIPPVSGQFSQPPPDSVPVVGTLERLQDLLRAHRVEMVLLTDVDGMKSEIVRLVNLCEKEMVEFKLIPSYFQILISGLHLQTVTGVPVLGVSLLPLDKWPSRTLKRLLDIVGAVAGLVLFAPVMALFCWLVYRESPGPVFYRQRRSGQKGHTFEMIKIRSMRLDAEKDGKVGWSTKTDSRRLRIGGFMRKYNIDELPQFWNVLRGEMSLVGPRPERPELIVNFKEEIPHYNARHNAKPGMTGWAQVKGYRGDTDLTERVRCDLFYLENWSLLLDLQIMLMTVSSNRNAC